jgi:radical SAM superfamily enzyme YgiQ (UPF0313 family)
VDENNILYPFFSILTPMPGTELHEEYKRDGRLDHTDWSQYDTRHVVMKPKHMTREQLMDGYIWMYEQAYRTTGALDRLERYWRNYRRKKSSFVENQFIKWRLRKLRHTGSDEFQAFVDAGWERLTLKGINSDVGQLLYYYDSAHFIDYMQQFKSENFARNTQIFAGEVEADPVDEALKTKQWETQKVKKRRQKSEIRPAV